MAFLPGSSESPKVDADCLLRLTRYQEIGRKPKKEEASPKKQVNYPQCNSRDLMICEETMIPDP